MRTIDELLSEIDKADAEHRPNRRAELADTLLDEIREIFDDDRLQEICEAERDGRLLVLPCMVGTRVWVIGQNCDMCRDMYAEEPCLFGDCEYKGVFESIFSIGMIDKFGKTVFLTREEAEAKLKELESELCTRD